MAGVIALTYAAPAALVEHCRRKDRTSGGAATGGRDLGDVAELIRWLTARDEFVSHDAWVSIGMALKLEAGADGFSLWKLTFDNTVTDHVAETKWESFASEPGPNCVTLNSWLQRANTLGWRGTLRKSTSAMFGTVAALAQAAGASLSGSSQPMPMVAGQAVLCDIGAPILAEFLTATADVPSRPAAIDYPRLPESVSGHGLYAALCPVIDRIVAMAEQPKGFRGSRIVQAAALISLVHQETADAIGRRAEAAGCTWPWRKIKLARTAFEEQVEREFVDQGDWHYDTKGMIESDNSDNVSVFLGVLGCELRWNAWTQKQEIIGWHWPDWKPIDDVVIARLRTRANRSKTRFKPQKEFLKETLLDFCQANPFDPVLNLFDTLAAEWDGVPRLSTWLTRTCGTPCDIYHQAVARNIIGGMVRRAKEPSCKHDTVAIFIGGQGSGKSTMCRVLAMQDEWFTDGVSFEGSPQNIVPQLFGKLVVELAELDGMARKEVQHVKRFLSTQTDSLTLKYNAYSSDIPRRCIFIGSSNDDYPLVDLTGNRRFLPVRVTGAIDIEWLRQNVRQIVGEAVTLHAAGADFSVPDAVWKTAGEHQEAARAVSDLEVQLHDWFGETSFTTSAFVTAADLDRACRNAGIRATPNAKSAIMGRMGFAAGLRYVAGKRTRVWQRGVGDVRYNVSSDVHGEVRVGIATA